MIDKQTAQTLISVQQAMVEAQNALKKAHQDEMYPDQAVENPGIGPSKGLGDTIAKVTTFLKMPPCGGCKERQETLNQMLPYGEKK